MIVAIDGCEVAEFTPEEANGKILGKAGTNVEITVKRDDVKKSFNMRLLGSP